MLASAAVARLVLVGGAVVLVGAALFVPIGGGQAAERPAPRAVPEHMDLSAFSNQRPKAPLGVLFIHHSVGGRWLADAGDKERIAEEIWKSHPQGGGLRSRLEAEGYAVHEASYGSRIGDATDRPDWLAKLRGEVDLMGRTALNDQLLPEGKRNQIVMFKSCFPNNMLGDDADLAKARGDLTALLPFFAQHPDMLFVHVTTPPLAPLVEKQAAWKWLTRALLGKPQPAARLKRSGPLARALNDWVVSPDGWLKGYPGKNVVVFDYYDVLTDRGKSDFLAFPSQDGYDSHPGHEGQILATSEFVPFLNRAVRRAGLSE